MSVANFSTTSALAAAAERARKSGAFASRSIASANAAASSTGNSKPVCS
jgi:hypothetical protein